MERKQIEFRQLCALVRSIIQQDPSIDDAEWKARTLETLAKWSFDEPTDHAMIGRAMTQVEFAVRKTLGPRPSKRLKATEKTPVPAPYVPERRTTRPAGWDLVMKLMGKPQQDVRASARSSGVAPPPRERLPVSEATAVNEFWVAANEPGADRLALLCAFVELAVMRPAQWDTKQVRQEADEQGGGHINECFACRRYLPVRRHHIIQVQHGGSNYARNLVLICEGCHATIHPWISGIRTPPAGWSSLAEMAALTNPPQKARAGDCR